MDFYFAQKTFFPKNLLPNSGCGLSTGAAYTRVNTVSERLGECVFEFFQSFTSVL